MAFSKKKNPPLSFLFSAIAFETFVILLQTAAKPSTAPSIFIYSPLRLAIIILLFLLFICCAWLNLQINQETPHAQKIHTYVNQKTGKLFLRYTAYVVLGINWILYFTTIHRFGKLKNYISIAKPLIALGIIISVQILLYLVLKDHNPQKRFQFFQKANRPFLTYTTLFFSCFLLLWVFIDKSGMGIISKDVDWNEAGVPILGWQVFIAVLVGILFQKFERKINNQDVLRSRKFDIMIFLLIWIIGGYLWDKIPVPNGYLNPGPYPPTNETYPFADAARFDIMSQYALIGQGLNNGEAYNRPVYPAFLVYIHILSGQSYADNMGLQAAIFAVFPALLYLLAKFLSNRSSGIAIATVIIFRGINGVAATNLINLANQKQMLTGFPTAILVGLILLVILLWLRQPNTIALVVLIGGIFGLGIYLRQTILGFFPVIMLLPFFVTKLKKQRRLIFPALLILGIITFGVPYEAKNYIESPYYKYPAVIKKIFTVVETRYTPQREMPEERERFVLRESPPSQNISNTIPKNISTLQTVGNHFARNIVTSTLILPHSISIDSLRDTIKAENSFWRPYWDGRLNIEQSLFLALNLVMISVGIVSAIYRFPIGGWLPLLFFFGYNLANALAKSSGGRYIVPVDWVVILYFMLGIHQLLLRELPITTQDTNPSFRQKYLGMEGKEIALAFILVLVMGTFLIIPDFIFHQTFNENNVSVTNSLVSLLPSEEKQTYTEELLKNEKLFIATGQIMYPRYYLAGDGEFSYYYPYKTLDYPRVSFIFIGPRGTYNAVMPGNIPKGLDNLSKAIIVGCLQKDENEKYIDVGIIFITSGHRQVYFREPLLEKTCNNTSLITEQE